VFRTLLKAPPGQAPEKHLNQAFLPQKNIRIERFPRATLVSSYFEDAAYERMQAAEMA
jgi:hypothetical protein